MVGLGAATADLLYACVAAFGLTAVSNAIATERTWIRLVGGAFLLFLGVRTFRAHPADGMIREQKGKITCAQKLSNKNNAFG